MSENRHPYSYIEAEEDALVELQEEQEKTRIESDGSSADYYSLPIAANQLQELISDKNMNAQMGEIFRECYRYGQASHCDELRGINKIIFYALAERKRLISLSGKQDG